MAPTAARGQFRQYTPPGQFEETRESIRVRLDRAVRDARWRAGRFYLSPWFALKDFAYIDNARRTGPQGPASDYTATIGAGVRAYRPVGAELTFAAHALPEYVYWTELSERRRLNGRYGIGLFGDLGRTGIEISASRNDDSIFFSREVEVPVNTRIDSGVIDLEVRVVGGVSLFLGGEQRRVRFLGADDPSLADLDIVDRDETLARAGLRISPRGRFSIGLGVESSVVDFEQVSGNRANEGIAPILELDFRGRVEFDADLAYRDLEPREGSGFVPYREVTGRFQLSLRPAGRFQPQLFGNRNLVYSVNPIWAYLEDASVGLGLSTSLGASGRVRLFAESGTNDYYAFTIDGIGREDDFTAVGGSLDLALGRTFLVLAVTRTEYDSNEPAGERTVDVFSFGVSFGPRSLGTWF